MNFLGFSIGSTLIIVFGIAVGVGIGEEVEVGVEIFSEILGVLFFGSDDLQDAIKINIEIISILI
tara:strand:- start:710 stop:904 length:195 start_codon:yes stop_codon:yes gene_type:complete